MAFLLKLINGVPRTVNTGDLDIFQETITAPSGGYPQGTVLTVPNSASYNSTELKLFYNGIFLEPGSDYTYVGSTPRNQITIQRTDIIEGDKLIFIIEGDFNSVYDEVIPATGYAAGSNITLPASETYNDIELKVYLDGLFLEPGEDYNYVGTAPRTEIQTVVEIFSGEKLRFRKEG